MPHQKNDNDTTSFIITGKLKTATIIYIISSILSFGGLIATVNAHEKRITKIEQQICDHQNQYNNLIGSLIRIEENAKFLKEKLDDMKSREDKK